MEIKAASPSSHVKIHKPVTTAASGHLQLIVSQQKKNDNPSKRDVQGFQTAICERVICSPCSTHATHGQEEGGAAPVLPLRWQIPVLFDRGPCCRSAFCIAACMYLSACSFA
jgi:hypothetical protein